MQLFDETTSLLVRVLDLSEARQQLITANIANEETPGYRARDLVFTEALAAALRGQPGANVRARHVPHFGVPGDSVSLVRGRIVELPDPITSAVRRAHRPEPNRRDRCLCSGRAATTAERDRQQPRECPFNADPGGRAIPPSRRGLPLLSRGPAV